MSITVYYIILILEFLTGVWCICRTIKYLCKQNSKPKKEITKNEKEPNILIVIPCLREQDIITLRRKTISFSLSK